MDEQTNMNQQKQNPIPTAQPQSKGIAIAALVLGIVAIVLCWIPFAGIVLGLIALILGIVGLKQSKGMGIAGIVLGALAIIFGLLITIAAMTFFAVLEPDNLIPNHVIFPAPITQGDSTPRLDAEYNYISVPLRNGKGNDIKFTGKAWINENGIETSCEFKTTSAVTAGLILKNSETEVLIWDCPGSKMNGEILDAQLKFEWENTETGMLRNHTGEVIGKYS